MEKVIGVKDLRNAGLLGAEYTELDLYDAFMMYLIVNSKPANGNIVLRNGDYLLDKKSCFRMDDWLVWMFMCIMEAVCEFISIRQKC